MQTSLKEFKIIARYIHKDRKTGKPNGKVSYLVRSSNGEEVYCTTLINSEASGCSCPSRKPCYHMIQLTQRETARTGKMALAKFVASKSDVSSTVAVNKKSAKPVDIGKLGNLNTGRVFSLMR